MATRSFRTRAIKITRPPIPVTSLRLRRRWDKRGIISVESNEFAEEHVRAHTGVIVAVRAMLRFPRTIPARVYDVPAIPVICLLYPAHSAFPRHSPPPCDSRTYGARLLRVISKHALATERWSCVHTSARRVPRGELVEWMLARYRSARCMRACLYACMHSATRCNSREGVASNGD